MGHVAVAASVANCATAGKNNANTPPRYDVIDTTRGDTVIARGLVPDLVGMVQVVAVINAD